MDEIVTEVKESEEWEEVKMNILELGMTKGVELGIQQGIKQGVQKGLVDITCKKLMKGYSIEEIADILEEDEKTIRDIVEIAQKYAPEYDTDKIIKAVWKMNNQKKEK